MRRQRTHTKQNTDMNANQILAIAIVLLILGGCGSPHQENQQVGTLYAKYDALLPELLEKRSIPGVAIAVIQNGNPVWSKGYGYSVKHSHTPLTSDTRFNIGSVSKAITAWAVLKLVESGLVELDAPADHYLKRWHLPQSDFDNSQVTVRRLLNHTSGLSTYPISESFNAYRHGSPMPSIAEALSRSYGSFGKLRLVQQPGKSFQYNNGNYAILQLLIEDVTGESFPAFMQHTIFNPLGMKHTGYHRTSSVAMAYGEGNEPRQQFDYVEQASGGIFTTVSDLATFVSAIDSSDSSLPGRGVLKPSTVENMISPSDETNGQYGLGYQMAPLKKNGYFVAHQGANEGFRSLFLFDREKRCGIVILTNSDVGGRIVADIVCVWAKSTGIELSNPCPDSQ
jgi:CubicO group peptidase (beta-lactamase class C family)